MPTVCMFCGYSAQKHVPEVYWCKLRELWLSLPLVTMHRGALGPFCLEFVCSHCPSHCVHSKFPIGVSVCPVLDLWTRKCLSFFVQSYLESSPALCKCELIVFRKWRVLNRQLKILMSELSHWSETRSQVKTSTLRIVVHLVKKHG